MPHIETIEPENATGELKDIYDDLIRSRGKIAEVHKIQSLNPKSIVNHMELYMTLMFGKSPLKRVYREMVAVVVSKANDCTYCQIHHAEAVLHYWKDQKRVDRLRDDYRKAQLSEKEQALCEYAWKLTTKPLATEDGKAIEKLRSAGWNDRAILDLTLVISYFNFVNRIVLSLGVQVEDDPGGYHYD